MLLSRYRVQTRRKLIPFLGNPVMAQLSVQNLVRLVLTPMRTFNLLVKAFDTKPSLTIPAMDALYQCQTWLDSTQCRVVWLTYISPSMKIAITPSFAPRLSCSFMTSTYGKPSTATSPMTSVTANHSNSCDWSAHSVNGGGWLHSVNGRVPHINTCARRNASVQARIRAKMMLVRSIKDFVAKILR